LIPADKLPVGTNFHLFKYGVRPEWEDAANADGGQWVYRIPAKEKAKIQPAWQDTILAIIGEQFDDSKHICGAVVSVRKAECRVALWISISDNEELCKRIGAKFKLLVGVKSTISFSVRIKYIIIF